MEKERAGVPPGIGPKLPEENPPPMKRKLTKRETAILGLAGILLVALATVFVVFALSSGRTARQAVAQAGGEQFRVQQEIAQVSLPGEGERSVYFYVSNDALACAFLERRASGYKVLNLTGHLALTAPGEDGTWMTSTVHQGAQQDYIVCGLLHDKSLTSVDVDGVPATVIDNGQYRIWFYYGEGILSFNSKSVVYS